MNTGAPWPRLIGAKIRVHAMQTKLHQWAINDPHHRHERVESRMRGDMHVRFGRRAEETDRE